MGDNFQLFCGQRVWNLCEQRQDNWQDKEKFPCFWSFLVWTSFGSPNLSPSFVTDDDDDDDSNYVL